MATKAKTKEWRFVLMVPAQRDREDYPEANWYVLSATATTEDEAHAAASRQAGEWLDDPKWVAKFVFGYEGLTKAEAEERLEDAVIGEHWVVSARALSSGRVFRRLPMAAEKRQTEGATRICM